MSIDRILVTGQFWEREFSDLVKGIGVPTTLLTCERIEQLECFDQKFDLVLVAQAGRQTISQNFVDRLRNMLGPEVPMINVLGSWCEGQARSGQPLQDVLPLYWHQWIGGMPQLLQFVAQTRGSNTLQIHREHSLRVGVSALVHAQADSLSDALSFWGVQAVWLEEAIWQSQIVESIHAIIIDGDSNTASLHQRLEQLRIEHPHVPLLICLNFPRKDEVLELQAMPLVAGVLSKPFDLSQLGRLLGKASGVTLLSDPEVVDSPASLRRNQVRTPEKNQEWRSSDAVQGN
jgi:hypothetical protein